MPIKLPNSKTVFSKTSEAVQWLRLCASTTGGTGSIPGWGTKAPHAAGRPKEKKQKLFSPIFLILFLQTHLEFREKNKFFFHKTWFSSVQSLSHVRLCDPMNHGMPPCPSPTPGVHPNPCPSSQWWHPTNSPSIIPLSSCPQSFPASGSFQVIQLFTSGGQGIGISASTSVLPMNTQDWSPLGRIGWISLQSKGLSRVFSNTCNSVIIEHLWGASIVDQLVKNLYAMQETWVQSLGWEDPLEKGMATHSSILVWRIPWSIFKRSIQWLIFQPS